MFTPKNRFQVHEAKSDKTKLEINKSAIIVGDVIPFSVTDRISRQKFSREV